MTTKIKASVLGYISSMSAGTIALNDGTIGSPNQGVLKFGTGNSIKITGGDGYDFSIAGAKVTIGDSTDVTIGGASGDTATGAFQVTGGGWFGKSLEVAGPVIRLGDKAGGYAGQTYIQVTNLSAEPSASSIIYAKSNAGGVELFANSSTNSSGKAGVYSINAAGFYIAEGVGSSIKFSVQPSAFTTTAMEIFTASTAATSSTAGGTVRVTGDMGVSGDVWTTVLHGTATKAQYGDVAEKYLADADYAPGTVVIFGGEKEITQSTIGDDRRVAGVISTNPAHLMNEALEGGLPVALTGRVPCKVVGYIRKGDLMVTSHIPGVARANNDPKMGTVIGKALEDYQSTEVGVIEVVVGRV